MSTVKILGYSERGIINSIAFFLSEQHKHIHGFLKILEIEDDFFDENCEYIFLNEQSFSDFGSNDWTIIAKKNKEKRVIFIEGKVKTYGKNEFSLDTNFKNLNEGVTFNGISSNIFVQLYYKYLLTLVLEKEQENTECLKLSDILKKNNRNGEKVARKIGENGIVKKAIEAIKGAIEYYYVAILPISKSNELKGKFKELNKTLLQIQPMDTKNVKQAYWADVEEHFKGISQIKDNFDFNKVDIDSQIY